MWPLRDHFFPRDIRTYHSYLWPFCASGKVVVYLCCIKSKEAVTFAETRKEGPIPLDSAREICDTTASNVDTRVARMTAARATHERMHEDLVLGVDWSVTSD